METNYCLNEFTSSLYSEEEIIRFYKKATSRHLNLKKIVIESFDISDEKRTEDNISQIYTREDSEKT